MKKTILSLLTTIFLALSFIVQAQGPLPGCKLKAKFDFKVDSCKVSFFDFSATGTGTTITSWFWDFGDGNTSTLQNPAHVYTTSGIYNVCLTIVGVNAAGVKCKDIFCLPVKVKACNLSYPCKLKAKFDFKVDSCNVSFFDFSATGTGTTITSWFWDFGDGNTSTLQNPAHVYTTSGIYNVCLTIVGINAAGVKCKDIFCLPVKVKACNLSYPCKLFPKFDFKIDGCKVSFSDFSVAGPGTTITNWFWDFGDGNTSTLQNPTHVYAVSGTYNVCLTIVGNNGIIKCKEKFCFPVTVQCGQIEPCKLFPKFGFEVDSCKVFFFDFSAAGPGTTITNWFWDFGDSNTSILQNPTHTYTTSGTYTVCLTIIGNNGIVKCKETLCLTVTVQGCGQSEPCKLFPKFDFKIDSCKISFFDASTAGPGTTITNWFWDFGDSNTSILQNPTHTYTTSGTYTVCLTIIGNNGIVKCKEEFCVPVTVNCGQVEPCKLAALFKFKIDSCKVSFFDFSVTGAGTTITNWFWDFGDGNTSILQNPTHVYASSGTYNVCLIIVGIANGVQCKDKICLPVTVHCGQSGPCKLFPKFDFKIDSCKVSFFDASAAGPGTTITSWFWEFGDGNTSTLQNPTHVYATSGTYVVCLTITGIANGVQCKERICMTISVHCGQSGPCKLFPKFDFKIDSCKVSFFDASAAGPGTTITSWFWEFGDGNTSTLQNPTHVYATSGTYVVCLTITGIANGVQCKERICMTITVHCGQGEPCQLFPKFDFHADTCSVVFFDASLAGPGTTITGWFWSFGDGDTSTLQNPIHVYATPGTYTICLTIVGVNAAGVQCKERICTTITVHCQPDPCLLFPKFGFQIDSCKVSFFDASVAGPGTTVTNWFWDFGDSNTSTLQNPTHVYSASGIYNVCLTVTGTNAAGMQCKERICLTITVHCGQTEPCKLFPKFDFKIDSCKVSFFDASAAGPGTTITSWFWSFGDGDTSTLQNPTHVYATSGTYVVCLTITGVNAAGLKCKDRICLTITVDCGQTEPCKLFPKFDFKIDSCKVSFFDASAAGPGTTITGWFWSFGDGDTSILQNPTHVYATSGTYVVCLTITGIVNGMQCKETICMTITVQCGQSEPCKLFPRFGFEFPKPGHKADSCIIFFYDFSLAGPGTTITSWFWDFGDGDTSTLQNPTHVYAASGIYKVCLTITGIANGIQCREQICLQVNVRCGQGEPCQLFPKFKFKVDSCTVTFFDFSTAGPGTTITSWFWDFGDGNTSTLPAPIHVYADSGNYAICLTITGVNAAGEQCTEQLCVPITVDNCHAHGISSDKINVAVAQLQVYPNPAHDLVNISFKLAAEEQVTITVTDVQGKTLSVLQDSRLAAGHHNLSWKAGISQGLYLITIKTDTGSERKQILIQ